jgi:hypothetical protein
LTIEEQGGVNLYSFCQKDGQNRIDPHGQVERWYTKGFDADAYGLVPWSLSFSFTTPWFIGAAGGASIEVVFNCRDGSVAAFGVLGGGLGFGTPGFGVS